MAANHEIPRNVRAPFYFQFIQYWNNMTKKPM